VLKSLTFNKLKVFGTEQTVRLAPITLIFGQNSAGKSSLLQSLLLLKQTFESQPEAVELARPALIARGSLVDLASFQSLVHRHDLTAPVTIGIAFNAESSVVERALLPARLPREFTFRFEWSDALGEGVLARTNVNLGQRLRVGFDAVAHPRDDDPSAGVMRLQPQSLARLVEFIDWALPRQSESLLPGRARSGESSHPIPNKNSLLAALARSQRPAYFGVRSLLPSEALGGERDLGGPVDRRDTSSRVEVLRRRMAVRADAGLELWGEVSRTLHDELAATFERLHYLGPLRQPPARFTIRTSGTHRSVGQTGANAIEMLYRRSGLTRDVNRWLERLSVPYTARVEAFGGDQVEGTFGEVLCLLLSRGGVLASATDVGFGVSQILPLVVQSQVSRGDAIAIEQPEIHLHPRLQAELGDLLIESSAERDNQFLVETHSEHLMLRLQRRIREGLPVEHVCVLYVDNDENGAGFVQELRLDEEGDFIDEWPHGFFDERYREMHDE
jgi:hypothetical protein